LVPINQKDKLVGRLLYFEANFKVYAFGYNVDLIPPLRVSSRGGFEALFCDTLIEFIFKGMLLPPHQQISMIQGEKVRKYSSAVNFINILQASFFVQNFGAKNHKVEKSCRKDLRTKKVLVKL